MSVQNFKSICRKILSRLISNSVVWLFQNLESCLAVFTLHRQSPSNDISHRTLFFCIPLRCFSILFFIYFNFCKHSLDRHVSLLRSFFPSHYPFKSKKRIPRPLCCILTEKLLIGSIAVLPSPRFSRGTGLLKHCCSGLKPPQ